MGEDIGTDCNAVLVAVQNDRIPLAFFNHVSGQNGSLCVFDDHTMAEMIIQVVCVHAKIETVDIVDGVLVFLELLSENVDLQGGEVDGPPRIRVM